MTNYRNRNFMDVAPPGPVPSAPVISKVTAGDTTAVVEWSYPGNAAEVDHWDLEVFQGYAQIGTVRIEGPDTRTHTLGELVNETTYSVQLQAVNLNGRSGASNRVDFTPKASAIPMPDVKSVIPKDGVIRFEIVDGPPPPKPLIGYKWIAKRVDSGYEFEGDTVPIVANYIVETGPVDNDRTYVCYLASVIEGGRVGPYWGPSQQVRPTKPVPPYMPTWGHIDYNSDGKTGDWLIIVGKGDRPGPGQVVGDEQSALGPLDVTKMGMKIVEKSSGKVIYDQTSDWPANATEFRYSLGGLEPVKGIATMTLWAMNTSGKSPENVIEFDCDPHDELPLDFGVWQQIGDYRYHFTEDNLTVQPRVNAKGVGLSVEVIVVGGGGGGHGRTTLGGLGGDGGAGNYDVQKFTLDKAGAITCKVGSGARNGDPGPGGDTTLSIVGYTMTAKGGGTSQGKETGSPNYTPSAISVEKLMPGAGATRWFAWNVPYSLDIGGAKVWDKNIAPDANLFGQAGGGTNSSAANRGGNGAGGCVLIRYKVADVPKEAPRLGWRDRLRLARVARKAAREGA